VRGILLAVIASLGWAEGADLQAFRSWSTLGAGSGVAWGETLLEVDRAPGGALVRFTYIGLRDAACGGITVLSWEKRVARAPRALAGGVDVCRLGPDFQGLFKRHKFNPLAYGTESDQTAIVSQCGGHRNISFVPPGGQGFPDIAEGSRDDVFLTQLFEFEDSIKSAAWGTQVPDIGVIDPEAERRGQEFAGRARASGYENEEPFHHLESLLDSYHGPLGPPAYEWQIEFPDGIKTLRREEPRLFRSGYEGGMQSYNTILSLKVDPSSGKVTSSMEKTADHSSFVFNRAIWSSSLNWLFDPATVPADGRVEVHVHFAARCGPE